MSQKSVEGMVVNVTKDVVVLLCPNGTFKNVPRAAHLAPPLLGERYIHIEKKVSWMKYISAVAVVFLAMLSYAMFPFHKESASYVIAIDINPSLELVVDQEMTITKVAGYNDEGNELLSSLHIQGNSLSDAIAKIVHYSFEAGYLHDDQLFLETSIIALQKDNSKLSEKIEETLKNAIPLKVEVKVTETDRQLYDESKEMNVSVNKLAYLKDLESNGVIENVQAGKGKTVAELRKIQKETNDGKNSNGVGNPPPHAGNGEKGKGSSPPHAGNGEKDKGSPPPHAGNGNEGKGSPPPHAGNGNRGKGNPSQENRPGQKNENKKPNPPGQNQQGRGNN